MARKCKQKSILLGALGVLLAGPSYSFENTKVPPKGVRSLRFKNVSTNMNQKTDADGNLLPLSKPMQKALSFKRVISGEANPFKRKKMEAFLLKEKGNLSEDDSLGQFSADLKATVDVFGPVFAWGITDSIAIAIGGPIYHMTSNAQMGFTPNDAMAQKVLNILGSDMKQPGTASEVYKKVNNAVGEVHKKLLQNGFKDLAPWEKTGVGDMTVAMKHRVYNDDKIGLAYQTGLVLPTGETDDPDLLTDLPMGDGQMDAFLQLAIDESLGNGFVLNQYAKYTYQAPGKKEIRLATAVESIRVEKERVDFKLGDKFDAGTSVVYESYGGIQAGLGATYHRKFGDRIKGVADEVQSYVTRESVQEATYGEMRIGYSSVSSYRRKEFPLPFAINFDYRKQLASKHKPVADMMELDFNLFF